MGFSGRLEGIAPSDILQVISQNRMTGTLIARCPDRTAMVVFKDGQVMEATSDAPQESLSYLLVSQGLMSEATIEAARERLKQEPDRSLGAILVEMGALSAKTLESVIFKQIGHIVHRLMSCDDGFLTFDRGEMAVKRKLHTREFFLPAGVSAEYLIMERARVVDEERRRVTDRRGHARGPLLVGETPHEASPAAGEQGRAGAAAAVEKLTSWFRGIERPDMAKLRSAAGSAVQKGKELSVTSYRKAKAFAGTSARQGKELSAAAFRKGKELAGSAGGWMRGTAMPLLASGVGKVRAWSPDGRAMMFSGIAVSVAGIALILLTTLTSPPPTNELLVTGRIVKVRADPTTSAAVVAKVERGETITSLSFNEGWHKVRTKAGDTGWVWQNLVEQKEIKGKGKAVGYGRVGSWCVFIAGAALLVMGVMRKRRIALASPRMLREMR